MLTTATTASRLLASTSSHRVALPAAASHAAMGMMMVAAARRSYATPMGPPPKGFRQPAPRKWDEDAEGTGNKLGKYFLMTEMARGMYVLLEQFFRPP